MRIAVLCQVCMLFKLGVLFIAFGVAKLGLAAWLKMKEE
jgi:hypothetical protein